MPFGAAKETIDIHAYKSKGEERRNIPFVDGAWWRLTACYQRRGLYLARLKENDAW